MANDVTTIINMSKMLRLLSFMETALTVGIIAFTVFRSRSQISERLCLTHIKLSLITFHIHCTVFQKYRTEYRK